jgi:hypothetical protein
LSTRLIAEESVVVLEVFNDIKGANEIEPAIAEWQGVDLAQYGAAAERVQPLDDTRTGVDEMRPGNSSLGRKPGPSSSRRGADGSNAEINGQVLKSSARCRRALSQTRRRIDG